MASGWGITGNKGRCYDFWIDFSECMSTCREPKDCSLLREDYLECLHHAKEFQRRNRIYKEEQRKIRAAARKAKGGDEEYLASILLCKLAAKWFLSQQQDTKYPKSSKELTNYGT
ncbi:hypothetical protein Ddye_016968 [Dipteronia dyeriana]|uniref:NADH dehydrogenase [ubiquinone] iron-sulfur protein 5 n=1 Tax=Dipteronia dyeriana TaxID=168575 RepID=A0AAD9U8B3_9ROSI|nr:hypothetical protein Ddye_016968 [Dipteronia dyeriana]